MASDHWLTSTSEADDPIREYGATTSYSSPAAKMTDHSDVDIQLADFRGVNFKDPLALERQPLSTSDEKRTGHPSTSLLSSHSSDHQSGVYSDTSFTFSQQRSWITHPKVRENWRVVLASAFLSLLGIALILTGIGLVFTPARGWHCLIFGFIGLLCAIPGGYHFVYIYCAALERPGYNFENIPVLR